MYLLARRSRALISLSLTISLGAMLARLIGSLIGLNWWTTYVLAPFRLDGLALGAFLAVMTRQSGGCGAAGASPASDCGRRRRTARGHLRLDAPRIAQGT
jgi:hypothetical protein